MPSVTFPPAGRARFDRSADIASVGAQLGARRLWCGLSVSSLADATGLSEDAIRGAELGVVALGERDYGALARVLGLPVDPSR